MADYRMKHEGADLRAEGATSFAGGFEVFHCPSCGGKLNNGEPITDEERENLPPQLLAKRESKILRMAPGAVLSCRMCNTKSTMQEDGTFNNHPLN